MIRWSKSSMNKSWAWALLAAGLFGSAMPRGFAATTEREPMTLRVVAVNPSADKTKTVPVRIDLPQEITPTDILDHGELQVDFDEERSLYYVYKPEVALAPKQTKVFQVVVRDVWFIPDADLNGLGAHTKLLMTRLDKSPYAESAKQLGNSVLGRLEDIRKMQTDETIGRKARIGGYRRNLLTIQAIKEDLERMEKLLTFAGGVPVPAMLEESPLKSDAPSTTTTWLVIFLIVVFMGLLAGQFFFTWHRRVKRSADLSGEHDAAFPTRELPHDAPVGDRGASN